MRVTARGYAASRCGGKSSPLGRRGDVAEPRGGLGPPGRLGSGVAPGSGPRQGGRRGHSPSAHSVVAQGVRGVARVVVDGEGIGRGAIAVMEAQEGLVDAEDSGRGRPGGPAAGPPNAPGASAVPPADPPPVHDAASHATDALRYYAVCRWGVTSSPSLAWAGAGRDPGVEPTGRPESSSWFGDVPPAAEW